MVGQRTKDTQSITQLVIKTYLMKIISFMNQNIISVSNYMVPKTFYNYLHQNASGTVSSTNYPLPSPEFFDRETIIK